MCCLFFKQSTAYEMRISDWSSDVCSSDLVRPLAGALAARDPAARAARLRGRGGAPRPIRRAAAHRIPRRGGNAGKNWKRVGSGQSGSVRVVLGGPRIIKKKISDNRQ